MAARKTSRRSERPSWLRRVLGGVGAVFVGLLATYFGVCTLLLLLYTQFDPLTTGVQMQRRVEALLDGEAYTKRYAPVERAALSPHLRHAVVAAEDGRFYEHGGIDWQAVEKAIEDNRRRGRTWRGGSTITQQLVKNLFITTHSTFLRKGLEVPLAYLAELILSKERLLDLYLNVVEWDHGVFGAEAAARHYYGISAAQLSRPQAAALAAVLPAPRQRSPQRMGRYTNVILRRMRQMGW